MANPEDCSVCFSRYSASDRRPRTLLCGHTFCSPCVGDMLEDGQVTCPTCRTSHPATDVTAFPISYDIEAFLKKLENLKLEQFLSTEHEMHPTPVASAATDNTVTEGNKKLACISRKLRFLLKEQKTSIKDLIIDLDKVQTHLDQYHQQLGGWKTEHIQQLGKLCVLVEKHKKSMDLLEQEDTKVMAMKEEGEEEKRQLRIALECMQIVSTAKYVVTAIDRADQCNMEAEDWKQKCNEIFPGNKAVTTSWKLRDDTRIALDVLAVQDCELQNGATLDVESQNGATEDRVIENDFHDDNSEDEDFQDTQDGDTQNDSSEDEHSQDPKVSIMDKIKNLTEDSVTVDDICRMSDPVRRLAKAGAVYGVHQLNGRTYSAKITIESHQVYLHCLMDQPPPTHARILTESELLAELDPSSTMTFIDLAWGGSTKGRVHIRLNADNTLATQFKLLCTGEKGHSYLNTVFLQVEDRGLPKERVFGGDYEYNNGEGGASLMNHNPEEYSTDGKAGTVLAGWGHNSKKNGQYIIFTKDHKQDWYYDLGQVVSGLDVVRAGVNHTNLKEVTMVDCGVVLPLRF